MSLRTLLDDSTCTSMLTTWPTQPAIYDLPADSRLPGIVNPEVLSAYLDTGAAPADQIIIIKDGAALHPRAYTSAGRLDSAKVAKWRSRGYTVQLRTINRWYPPLHDCCTAIQQETGYGCFVTGFITPAGQRGLNPHWDQNLGLIYQLAGHKTWQLWKPVVEQPHRHHLASNTRPSSDLVDRLTAAGPDQELVLGPGQVLVLPRGWMHHPHTHGHTEESLHLTFVVRERTGFWIGEKLTQAAIASTPLRRVIPPARVVDPTVFADQVNQARNLLLDWLARADTQALATDLLDAARTEPDVDYA
jgi:ribosomal protein L16 Arg81 hydroxylase